MGCPGLTYRDYFFLTQYVPDVEAQPKSAHRRNDDGCMLTNGAWTYTWNAENRLTEAETNVGASPRWRITFSYDYMGRRVEKKTYTGTIRAHYEYSPFGKITAMTGDKAADNPFRFSSEYHDDETALVYYNYRYYSPELGRWLKRDDIGERGGVNLYNFLNSDPISKHDYLGLCCKWMPGCGVMKVVGECENLEHEITLWSRRLVRISVDISDGKEVGPLIPEGLLFRYEWTIKVHYRGTREISYYEKDCLCCFGRTIYTKRGDLIYKSTRSCKKTKTEIIFHSGFSGKFPEYDGWPDQDKEPYPLPPDFGNPKDPDFPGLPRRPESRVNIGVDYSYW